MTGTVFNNDGLGGVHIVKMHPNIHRYENNVVKYTCPVCDASGDFHSLHPYRSFCPICGVNIIWPEDT